MKVTKREAGLCMVAINAMFPQRFPLPVAQDLKEIMIGVWHEGLQDLESGEALKSCRVLLRSAQHPPVVADIRKAALAGVLDGLTGADAWDLVCKAISADGMNRPERARARWKDPAITASVNAIGGWRSICLSDNPTADRAQFIRHFDGQMERAKRAVLAGKAPSIRHALEDRQRRTQEHGQIEGESLTNRLLGRGEP